MSDISIFRKQLNIEEVKEKMLQGDQIDLPITHTFSGGIYLRQMFMPKGVMLVGKRHRHKTCNMLLKGDMSVFLSGGQPLRIKGPLIFESEPNVRKLLYAHEDTTFMNIHPTSETDLEKIEKEFIITDEEFERG